MTLRKVPDWDQYFMTMAYLVAMRSKDRDTNIGAVIVARDNSVISTGYNSFVRGVDDYIDARYERPEKYFHFEHAERNAIYNAAKNGICTNRSRMYTVGTPCADCARAIIQAGIVTVIVHKAWEDVVPDLWAEHAKRSRQMFIESGVDLIIWDGDVLQVTSMFRGDKLW